MGRTSPNCRRHARRQSAFTLVELLVIITITLFLLMMLVPPYYFALSMLGIAGAICMVLFVALVVRKQTRLASIGPLVALAALLVPTYWQLAKLTPLDSIQVAEARFDDKPLVDVLQSLAGQRKDSPFLRFRVASPDLARQRVTVHVPQDTPLREAIERTAVAADCDYEWQWWNGRIAMLIILCPRGEAADIDSDSIVAVYDDSIIWPE